MKDLITLVVVVMTMGVNTLTAQKYKIDPETQEVSLLDQQLVPLELRFEANVPLYVRTDLRIMIELVRDGEVVLATTFLKGQYSTFILYYSSKSHSEILSLKNGVISYNPSFIIEGEKKVAWWYVYWIIGLIAMLLFHKTEGAAWIPLVSVGVAAFVNAFVCAGAGAGASLFVYAYALIFALAVAYNERKKNDGNEETTDYKKKKSCLFYVYYAFTIIAMVFAYYQIGQSGLQLFIKPYSLNRAFL